MEGGGLPRRPQGWVVPEAQGGGRDPQPPGSVDVLPDRGPPGRLFVVRYDDMSGPGGPRSARVCYYQEVVERSGDSRYKAGHGTPDGLPCSGPASPPWRRPPAGCRPQAADTAAAAPQRKARDCPFPRFGVAQRRTRSMWDRPGPRYPSIGSSSPGTCRSRSSPIQNWRKNT